jgi:small subunit ribosomal protein S2
MAMPTFTMRQLLESGVHYGHNTRRWNPKMAPYIFGERSEVHILDLQQTVPMLQKGLEAANEIVKSGGRVLFVGTKVQGSEIVKEAAKRCGQYYINHRWLGGLLTNWKTVNQSIKRLKEMREELANPGRMTKKEILKLQREHDKLDMAIGGIADMGGLPDMLFVLDTNKEAIAVQEAQRLSIPIVAIIDSNSTPDFITYPIPGNDDATRAIRLYCDLMADAILDGLQKGMISAGIDIGASADLIAEQIPQDQSATVA